MTLIKLNNGVVLPLPIAYGTWKSGGESLKESLKFAISIGLNRIDTAAAYKNEKIIGEVIKNYKRDEIFITSKLPPSRLGFESTLKSFHQSLSDLGTDYLDLYLIHWPGMSKTPIDSTEPSKFRKESWKALESLYFQKKVRAIGVSNYTIAHLTELLKYANIIPQVNQVEFHPLLYQKDLHQFCEKAGILLEAYSPLGDGSLIGGKNEIVTKIANELNISEAQLLIKWGLQKDVSVVFKSLDRKHIQEDFDVLQLKPLSNEVIEELDNLNCNKHFMWDSTNLK